MTPWLLHDAAQRAGTGAPFTEVYAIWVLAGPFDYDENNVHARILDDFRENAYALFTDFNKLYAEEVTRPPNNPAEGRITIHRIYDRRLHDQKPQATMRNGTAPAKLDFIATWRDPLPPFVRRLVPDALEATSLLRDLGDLPAQHWIASLDTPGYRLHPGGFRWDDDSAATTMTMNGAMTEDLRTVALRRMGSTDTKLLENLSADLVAVPVKNDLVPYLQRFWVPIATPVTARAHLSVAVRPLHWFDYLIAAAAVLGLLVAARFHFRRRPLHWRVTWPSAFEFRLKSNTDIADIPLQWALEDHSGMIRRKGKLKVEFSIARTLTSIPLRAGKPLFTISPSTVTTSKPKRRWFPSPRSPGQGVVRLRVHGDAIDVEQLKAGSAPPAGVSIDVRITDASDRYQAAQEQEFYGFDVVVLSSDANVEDALTAQALSPIRVLFRQPPQRVEVQRIGWARLENRAAPGYVARDVSCRITKVSGRFKEERRGASAVEGSLAVRPTTATGRPAEEAVLLRNGEAVDYDLYLTLDPAVAWSPAAKRRRVSVNVDAEIATTGESQHVLAQPNASFEFDWYPFVAQRHACLDLGTSSVRFLLNGGVYDAEKWGFVRFDLPPIGKTSGVPPEDFPSYAFFKSRNDVAIGTEALNAATRARVPFRAAGGATPSPFRASIKETMIDDLPEGVDELGTYVQALVQTCYKPVVSATTTVRYPLPQYDFAIRPEAADILVASVPNDCSRRYREAYEEALMETKCFKHVFLLREAEAVALWYPNWRRDQALQSQDAQERAATRIPKPYEILIVDVGAGTTDAALALITEPNALQSPAVEIRSVGAVSLAGRHIDRMIVDELLSRGWLDRSALTLLNEQQILSIGEQVKIAISQARDHYRHPPLEVAVKVVLQASQLQAIEASSYRAAINEIVAGSLSVLLGRMPTSVDLTLPKRLIVTGRGSLVRGLTDEIIRYLGSHGVKHVTPVPIPHELLKASVTIGCHLYAAGYWSTMKRSDDISSDRMLLVYERNGEFDAVEMLPPNHPIHTAGPWTRIPEWHDARLIATHLRYDSRITDPNAILDAQKIRSIFHGSLHSEPGWHVPYVVILGPRELPRSDGRRVVEARIVLGGDGQPRVEERPISAR